MPEAVLPETSWMLSAIVFLPLIGFLLAGLFVRVIGDRAAQFVTCVPMLAAAVFAGMVFQQVALGGAKYVVTLFPWMVVDDFAVSWALRADTLTAVMLVVVTWVSSVVHLYSIGYMSHDEHKPRFMAYLSLFTFCMLVLVTADNFLQLFVGWEGVGLASYLLIGFWFKRESANAAAIKAFVVNRVGDVGLVMGMLAIYTLFGTLQFDAVFEAAPLAIDSTFTFLGDDYHALTLICLLLFVGCMGKSAQLGLHTWLPDAMEGPTPVSALIHAATMVTAGVFLVARCSPLYELAPNALIVVTIVGALTAFFAASIGLVQTDIKKVIAYSTCSQLGYMFFACGVGAYPAAIFHLMTHAFFKALLFLGAGSVIHGMHDEQDMMKMGGLMKKMPWTYINMLAGTLAILGVPIFAGYYSKEAILSSAFAAHTDAGEFAFWMGLLVAAMTTFYSLRLLFLTFHGKTRADHHTYDHAHESPLIMNVPMLLLLFGAIGSGWIGVNVLNMLDPSLAFWNGAIVMLPGNPNLEELHHVPLLLSKSPLVIGIALAVMLYLVWTGVPAKIAAAFRPIHRFLMRRWLVDELYNLLFVRGAQLFGAYFWRLLDIKIIDGLGPNGFAQLTQTAASRLVRLQTGLIYHYAFVMLLGVLAMIAWLYFTLMP